jgi:hypothetical protein
MFSAKRTTWYAKANYLVHKSEMLDAQEQSARCSRADCLAFNSELLSVQDQTAWYSIANCLVLTVGERGTLIPLRVSRVASSAFRSHKERERKIGDGLFLYGLECVLTFTADGANPIVGQVFEGCAGSDITIGITCCGIVDPLADCAFVLFHKSFVFKLILLLIIELAAAEVHGRIFFELERQGRRFAEAFFLNEGIMADTLRKHSF